MSEEIFKAQEQIEALQNDLALVRRQRRDLHEHLVQANAERDHLEKKLVELRTTPMFHLWEKNDALQKRINFLREKMWEAHQTYFGLSQSRIIEILKQDLVNAGINPKASDE